MKLFIFKVAPYLFWAGIVALTVLLLMEVVPTVGSWPYRDKVYHLVAFFGISGLGFLAYQNSTRELCLGVAVYGGAMELLQGLLTTTRMPSVLDWVADLVGIVLAIFIFVLLKPFLVKADA